MPLPPFEPTDASIAGETDDPAEVEPAPPAEPVESRPVAPAAAPTALSPVEPTAMAPPATNAPLEIRSPPERPGEPPRTAANSLGICQHSIIKMMEPPMISRADIAGLALAAIFCASATQSTDISMPVPINRYKSMIFTPVETPSPMYRSTYGAVQRDPPNPTKINPAATMM